MRILIFLALLITLHLTDCLTDTTPLKPKDNTLHPLKHSNFNRINELKPTIKDTLIIWERKETRFPLLEN